MTNQDIEAIHQLVKKVKSRKEVGINYMKSWELEKIYREEGRQEGREEGRQEGREEGRQEGREDGIKALIRTCQNFKASKEETASQIMQNFPLKQEEAEAYIQEYWE